MKLKLREIKWRDIDRGESITLYEIGDKKYYFTKWMDYTETIQDNFFDNLEEAEAFYNDPKWDRDND